MQNTRTLKAILLISGAIAAIIGLGMLFVPVAFHATSGITLNGEVNLMSEMRAAGGAMLAAAAVIIAGAFRPALAFTSTSIAAVFYLGYGLSRILSLLLDGTPSAAMLQVAGFEIVVGLICAAALLKLRRQPA